MIMRNLGLSIYPDHSEYQKDAEYLELGHKYGFRRIFMSMLEVQGSVEETKAKYQKIIGFGNSLGYQTFIDVSPGLFKRLGISYSDLKFWWQSVHLIILRKLLIVQRKCSRTLLRHRNKLPKYLTMYSVAGTKNYVADGIVPVSSVEAGKYIYQGAVRHYT